MVSVLMVKRFLHARQEMYNSRSSLAGPCISHHSTTAASAGIIFPGSRYSQRIYTQNMYLVCTWYIIYHREGYIHTLDKYHVHITHQVRLLWSCFFSPRSNECQHPPPFSRSYDMLMLFSNRISNQGVRGHAGALYGMYVLHS